MDKATDKQIYFLKSKGIDASNMAKETASEMISNLKGGAPQETQQFPVEKPGFDSKENRLMNQPKVFDKTSYYVAYAKDLFCAIYEKTQGNPVDCVALMNNCVDCIKLARSELNHN